MASRSSPFIPVLDADYFAVAMHLTMKAKRGQPLPETLTPDLIPPKHR